MSAVISINIDKSQLLQALQNDTFTNGRVVQMTELPTELPSEEIRAIVAVVRSGNFKGKNLKTLIASSATVVLYALNLLIPEDESVNVIGQPKLYADSSCNTPEEAAAVLESAVAAAENPEVKAAIPSWLLIQAVQVILKHIQLPDDIKRALLDLFRELLVGGV
jgi:hypothetical protein